MRQGDLDSLLGLHGLGVLGSFTPTPQDQVPVPCATLALIGPAHPDFWDIASTSPEFADGTPDPLDRWSAHILDKIAADTGARALYPFGGPPWHPFIAWAKRTGRIHTSPVTLLVHDTYGLFASFRGALALPKPLIDTVPARGTPCETCAGQPCRTACPVDALSPGGYDVALCHAHLDTSAGSTCLQGCLARRACPVGASYRTGAQSAYHMSRFHPGKP